MHSGQNSLPGSELTQVALKSTQTTKLPGNSINKPCSRKKAATFTVLLLKILNSVNLTHLLTSVS